MFQDSMQALKVAQTKFQDSLESLEPINKDLKEKPMLVPLTASVSFSIFKQRFWKKGTELL